MCESKTAVCNFSLAKGLNALQVATSNADPGLYIRNHLEEILPLAKKSYKRDMVEEPILDSIFVTT